MDTFDLSDNQKLFFSVGDVSETLINRGINRAILRF